MKSMRHSGEDVLFEEDDILISTTRCAVKITQSPFQKSYAMRDVISVHATSERRRQDVVIMIGIVLTVAGALIAFRYVDFGSVWLGVIICSIGIGAMLISERWNRHTLVIGLPSGEVPAYTHYSENRVRHIVDSIVDAMLRRAGTPR